MLHCLVERKKIPFKGKKNPKSSSFTIQLKKCILNILNVRGFQIILKHNELNNITRERNSLPQVSLKLKMS